MRSLPLEVSSVGAGFVQGRGNAYFQELCVSPGCSEHSKECQTYRAGIPQNHGKGLRSMQLKLKCR